MTVLGVVAISQRAHMYKVLACIVLVLITLQYLLNGAVDRRPLETPFTIDSSRAPHPRGGFIVYGPATDSSNTDEEDGSIANSTLTSSTSQQPSILPMIVVASAGVTVNLTQPTQQKPDVNLQDDYAGVSATNGIKTNGGPAIRRPSNSTPSEMPKCQIVPPNLVGPLAVSKSPPEVSAMEKAFVGVRPGGRGSPEHCAPRHRVAIVVPFRDRFQHLTTLLYNLHPVLLRQQIDYQVFVVEQEGSGPFNRAMLMNVGSVEALKEREFDCFIFHDVDLLPEDDRNLYTCPEQPRHMSVAVDKFHYRLPYSDLFGGVSAMTVEQFQLVNGFSNFFWGWGGEDDDMANRIKAHGLHISRYPINIARYKMLNHKKEKANPKRYEYLKNGKKRYQTDGLSSLQYDVISKKRTRWYTWFLVRLTPPSQIS